MHPRNLRRRKDTAEENIARRVSELAKKAGLEPPAEPGGRTREQRSMHRLEAIAGTLEKLPEPESKPQAKSKKQSSKE